MQEGRRQSLYELLIHFIPKYLEVPFTIHPHSFPFTYMVNTSRTWTFLNSWKSLLPSSLRSFCTLSNFKAYWFGASEIAVLLYILRGSVSLLFSILGLYHLYVITRSW